MVYLTCVEGTVWVWMMWGIWFVAMIPATMTVDTVLFMFIAFFFVVYVFCVYGKKYLINITV